MKKLFLLLAGVTMMASSAMAQLSLVKEVEKVAGSNDVKELASALDKIQPALTNAETMNNAQTWFAAGKLSFKLFDQLQGMKSVNQSVDDALMTQALNNGFNYMMKALPLDSVKETNKDGSLKLDKSGLPKIKTKYSKEIVQALLGHLDDAGKLADGLRLAEDYAGAAKAYDTFCNLVTSPFAKAQNINYPDSTISEIKFLEGFSYFFAKDYANALPQLTAAKKLGYTENQIDEFVIETLQNLVQERVNAQDFASAYQYLNEAIANDPTNGRIYDVEGRVCEIENEKDVDRAISYYKKAIELNPDFTQAFYDLGRAYCLKAQNIINDNPEMNNAQIKDAVEPIYKEALPLLEKVSTLEPDGENAKQAKRLIEDIDYKKEVLGIK